MTTLLTDIPAHEIVLVEELPAHETAWEVCRKLAGLPHLLFLDSAQNSPQGRYSFVAADPFGWLWSHGRRVFTGEGVLLTWGNPLIVLEEKLEEYRVEPIPGLPPFQGGGGRFVRIRFVPSSRTPAQTAFRRVSGSRAGRRLL